MSVSDQQLLWETFMRGRHFDSLSTGAAVGFENCDWQNGE